MIGKKIRMDRIMDRNTKKTILVPMDHGVSMGPIPGISNISETIDKVVEGGANAVVIHKGIVKSGYRGYGSDVGLMIHLNGSTSLAPDPNAKVPVCNPEEAIRKGADGVSIHVNIGASNEGRMLKDLAETSEICDHLGLPLLAMMYPRGPKIKDPKEHIGLVSRVAFELGADIIKTSYTGDHDSFARVVDAVCGTPVVIAGGEKTSTKESLQTIKDAMNAGSAGVACGRNVFQHDDPTGMVKAIADIVHKNAEVKEALQEVKE